MQGSKNISLKLFAETIALVVCGGQSSRMGTDKSLLQYHKKPQRYHVYDMLAAFCKEVYISCNAIQADTAESDYPYIVDEKRYANIGPMAALLTAADLFPEENILFIGCDYPFLEAADLKLFSDKCGGINPVAFYNETADLFEPLLAWYPHGLFGKLIKKFESKQYSLQHFLKENNTLKFYSTNTLSMISVDTPEAYTKTLNSLNP